ncbi:uncharacterized protein N0V89_009811 [Didymosphaeria variabile]|uniref:Uncharacterized protein n=1 Tax=Didymosphaeria variabile TaxID=1932322 RepID=A0A9W8XEJ2_9PLEO|nr:uncharacterized protein N0V89_009811 [Didymosphaeria variabile]KAJ4348437.1 hypothetical protein N0V89_009811 [Didymosphaeria variabile]
MSTASQPTSCSTEGTGIRKTLRRWKDKWRTSSTPSSRTSSPRAPLSRLPSNASSAAPSHRSKPATEPLPPIPASPPPVPTALFTPTTETFIHSPADPRNRSRNSSNTSSTSPPGTLKKPRPVSRRNTAPSDFLTSALPDENRLPDHRDLPMNVVTTTIVAGNGGDKRKRTSRLRLSISRRGSILSSSPSSPSLNSQFERSSSRATSRMEERSTSRAANRVSVVPESWSPVDRVDSDRETLFEETELIKRRPKELKELANERDIGTVELAYQYVGSRDGRTS